MRAARIAVTLGVVTAATVGAMVIPGPAGAIVGWTDDTANRFQNVGALQLQDDGEWFDFCTGTLVAPDVVLTAAHCTDFFTAGVGEEGLGPDDLRVSFDPAPDEDSTYYVADRIVIHPDWASRPAGRGNSKHIYLAPPAEDIALIFLEEEVSGVTPTPVASATRAGRCSTTGRSWHSTPGRSATAATGRISSTAWTRRPPRRSWTPTSDGRGRPAGAQQQRARGLASRSSWRQRSKSRRDITGSSGCSRRTCST